MEKSLDSPTVSPSSSNEPESEVVPIDSKKRSTCTNDDGFFGSKCTTRVREIVQSFSIPIPSTPPPDETDSQCTVMTEITILYDRCRQLPLTWDLVTWDAYDRRRLWYHTRTPTPGVDPFQYNTKEWIPFGLRPRNWTMMHENEYYPWLQYVTREHLDHAATLDPPNEHLLRPYDSTGLTCRVEVWCGVNDTDHLLRVDGSADASLGKWYFISLFWKYRMASQKIGSLQGTELLQSWNAFHRHMKTSPVTVYERIEEFYHRTIEGTLVRIHETSRNHGLACAVPMGIHCPMCTSKTPKLAAICWTDRYYDVLPLEIRSYIAQLKALQVEKEKDPKRQKTKTTE